MDDEQNTAIALHNGDPQGQVSTKKQLSAGDVWESLVAMATDDTINPEKLRALTDIQGTVIQQMRDEKDREAKARFTKAFATACRQMPIITKDEKIEHKGRFIGWFKKYEDLRRIVDQVVHPLGLTVSHDCSEIDGGKGGILVWTVITYMDGEHTWSETKAKIPVPPDGGGAKGAAQALGSSKTYGERYSLTGAFGIVQKGLDRDGKSPEARALLANTADHQVIIDAGQSAAAQGAKAYAAWLNGLTNVQKGWLITHGHHDELSKAARAHDAGGNLNHPAPERNNP